MEYEIALAITSFLGGFTGAGVVISLIPRQIAVRDVEASAELTSAMTSLSTELTRLKMRSVRAAAKDAAASPEPRPVAPIAPNVLSKDQLRALHVQRMAIK